MYTLKDGICKSKHKSLYDFLAVSGCSSRTLRWVLGQDSLLPLSQGEAFTLASISYLAILVKYILAKKNKQKKHSSAEAAVRKVIHCCHWGRSTSSFNHQPIMDRIHQRGKMAAACPRWYNAALTHTKWMGNPSSPTLSSNCENRRPCFCQTSPGMNVWGVLVPIRTVFNRSNRPRG